MKHPIPAEALKESVAIIGRRGSGKTYTAKGAVELLLRDQARVCIIDPTGVWYGLRSSVDGKKPAFPIVVFGGDHADVPIAESSGTALATMLAGRNLPAIIDLSELTRSGMVRFADAFLEALYRANRQPMTLVVDEADIFAPQRPEPDTARMLGRMEQIVRRGRVRGFRPWLITQRPASLNKNVLSQANTLIAMQLTAPQDRDALGAWIDGQADREEGKRILADLPRLQKGEGYVWAPSHGILDRVQFPKLTTFDSSRSPEDGETLPQITVADVDLGEIGESLREVEREAAANDPKLLRKRIAELEREASKPRDLAVDVEALRSEYRRGRDEAIEEQRTSIDAIVTYLSVLFNNGIQAAAALNDLARDNARPATLEDIVAPVAAGLRQAAKATADDYSRTSYSVAQAERVAARQRATAIAAYTGNGAIPKGERALLIALAQYPSGCSRDQISVLVGYKKTSRDTYIQRLTAKGHAETDGGIVRATADGIKALGKDYVPLPRGAALLRHWLGRLPTGEAAILDLVVSKYPKGAERDWLSDKSGYKKTSRDTYIQRLSARKLVSPAGRGEVKASDDLF